MKISVALAYHDGAEHIEEQLRSILNQFGKNDELILSVDRAFDGSMDLLKSWEERDKRIFLTLGPSRGVGKNYEHAISMCSGDLIFLSSQDDPWLPEKITRVKNAFHDKEVMAGVHDGKMMDEEARIEEETIWQKQRPRTGYLRNLWKNSYLGSCMAFRRELIPYILPIPEAVYQYDYWIGTVAELAGKVVFLEEPLILYRNDNHTNKNIQQESGKIMAKKRRDMLIALLKRKREIRNEKK